MKEVIRRSRKKSHSNSSYLIRIETGLILSLSILLAVFKMDLRADGESDFYVPFTEEIVQMEQAIQTKQQDYVPPPPRPVVPIEVPNSEIIEDEIIFMDSELNIGDFNEIPILPPSPQNMDNEEEEEEIFVVVEQAPELIGGLQYAQSLVRYPQMAIEANIQGRVVVQMVIDKNGNVQQPRVVRGIGGGCDEEAIRVLKQVKFKPGMQRGKPVSVQYTIPIVFKIKE